MMKTSHIILTGAVLLAASSCSLLKPDNTRSARIQTVEVANDNSPGTPRSPIPTPPKIAGERPDQTTLCGGRWLIASVDTYTIEAEDNAPYIDFESGTGRFYGNDGCNIINGDYLLRSDGAMVFSHVLSTLRYCPDSEYSALIGRYLSGGDRFYVDTKRVGQDTYLYLRTDNDKVVITLRRHNMEFLNGNWQVTGIGGHAIDDEECNIFFDIAELKVHGNTGCNFFNGSIYIDPNRSNALDLSNMGTTRMACPKGDQEMKMMVALESTASAIAGDNGKTVILLDAKGKEMLTLRRIPVPQMNQE